MNIEEVTKEIKKRNPGAYEEFKKNLSFHVGLMISEARLKMGMTQKELAEKVDTKQSAIARIESGSSLPSLAILDKIAKLGFNSYLVPPRFAFMHPDTIFIETAEKTENTATGIISGTLNRQASPYSFSFAPESLVLKAEKNNKVNPNYLSIIK